MHSYQSGTVDLSISKDSKASPLIDDDKEEVDTLTRNMTDAPRPTFATQCRNYLRSGDCIELIAGLALFMVSAGVGGTNIAPRQRALSYQVVSNSDNNNNNNGDDANGNGMYIRNLMFDQPVNAETVPNLAVVLLSLWVPLILQMVLSSWKGLRGDRHKTICVYLVAIALTGLATECIKLYVGYFRPIFYSICNPSDDYSQCTSDDVNDARKSFLSGHSSLSFAGLGQLFLYIHKRFGVPSVTSSPVKSIVTHDEEIAMPSSSSVQDDTAHAGQLRKARLCSILALIPMALAVYIAASRIVDNRHHPADVVGGSVLGASLTIFVHGLWFH
jgi:membrane-associated phospholipid phosphatase